MDVLMRFLVFYTVVTIYGAIFAVPITVVLNYIFELDINYFEVFGALFIAQNFVFFIKLLLLNEVNK